MPALDLPAPLARKLLKAAADYSFSAITVTRAASEGEPGEIIYVNGAFEDLTGYRAEEVIGQTPGVLQGPETEQEVLSRLDQKLKAGEVFHGKATNYRKDGSAFTMEWKVIPLGPVEDRGAPSGEGKAYHVAVQREAPGQED